MFRIAVCDDCREEANMILSMISEYQAGRPEINIIAQYLENAVSLLDNVEAGQRYNLLLLDILMPGLTGIELAQKLRSASEDVPMAFLTNSADYALDAFRVSASQYLLKPIEKAKLFSILDKIITVESREKESFFILSAPDGCKKIQCSEIIYIELIKRALQVHLRNGTTSVSKIIRVSFEKSVESLLQDYRFLYPHKSFLLNMAHIQEMTNHSFIMSDNTEIHVPRYKFTTAKSKYLTYLSQTGNKFSANVY